MLAEALCKLEGFTYRINQEILKEERATYGAEILPTLSAKLAREYGSNFSEKTSDT